LIYSFDCIGLAGFSHNFGTLEGKESSIFRAMQSFGTGEGTLLGALTVLLSQALPSSWLTLSPTMGKLAAIRKGLAEVGEDLIKGSKGMNDVEGVLSDTSALRLMRKCSFLLTKWLAWVLNG
jgi:hypothetical protein